MENNCIKLKLKNKTEYNKFDALWEALLSALFSASLILCLLSLTSAEISYAFVLLFSAVITALCCALLHNKKLRFLGFALPLALAAAVVLFFPKIALNGLYLSYNGVLNALGETTALIMPKISTDTQTNVLIFWIVLSSLLAVPVALSVYQKHSSILAFLALAVLIFCGYTGRVNPIGAILLLVSCAAQVLSKNTNSAAQTKRVLVYRTVSLVLCSSVLLLTLAAVSPFGISSVAENTQQAINNARFGGSSVLPQGDFTKLKDFAPTENPALEVVMSKPESYYLRGYVGEVYIQTGWEPLKNGEKYKNSDLFYTLHDGGFFAQTQLAAVQKAVEGESEANTVTVKNIAISRAYIYAPYEVISADESILSKRSIGDEKLSSNGFFGSRSYRLTAAENQVKRYTTLCSKLNDLEKAGDKSVLSLLSLEQYYNSYAYENYLDMPSDTYNILKSLLGDYEDNDTHLDYSTAKQKILTFLTSNCTYSEKAEPIDGDFATDFLVNNPKGYSVHFATAAVLMFRYYGIPSRYVEGYIITPDDVNGAEPNTALTIDETHAHAWAEFYQDGVGWIPFEATPPYLDVMEKADDLSGVQANEQNKKIKSNKTASRTPPATETVDEMLKQDTNQSTDIFFVCVAAALSLLLIFAVVLFLRYIFRKRRLNLAFSNHDSTAAVKNMFAYSAALLVKMNALKKPEDIYSAGETLATDFDEEYIQNLKNALEVYQKAVFGGCKISESERESVRIFKEQTDVLYKNRKHSKGKKGGEAV